jgi:glutathione S-transferase
VPFGRTFGTATVRREGAPYVWRLLCLTHSHPMSILPFMTTLYYSRNPNPRLALTVARYLGAPVTPVWCSPFDPAQSAFFRTLNPALRIPILLEDGHPLWEADAIACRLSQMMKSDFWRMGRAMPEMIRWISWGKANFMMACDMVHFELGTKQRYGLGPVDQAKLAEGRALFAESAGQLDRHLTGRVWLVDDAPSYADFRVAAFLPFNDVAGLPLGDYPAVSAWAGRLADLPFWADPFEGLEAPALDPIPG